MDKDHLLLCPKLDQTSKELSKLYWDARRLMDLPLDHNNTELQCKDPHSRQGETEARTVPPDITPNGPSKEQYNCENQVPLCTNSRYTVTLIRMMYICKNL
jgi:hypothetical protein